MDKNSGYYHDNTLYYQDDHYDSDELDYSGGMRRKQKLRPLGLKRAHYSLKVEYPTQPGYGVNRGPQAAKGGYISRTKVGYFKNQGYSNFLNRKWDSHCINLVVHIKDL